jgi:circadian clock protein KaiC
VSERLSSGHANLDGLLGGGLPAGSINMVIGAPGSGKTILAQQYLFHNATPERPGLYVTTVSEPFDKVVRYAQALDFFDATRVGREVIYEDLGAALHDDGLEGALKRLIDLLQTHRPALLVIDSFKALGAFAADAQTFRRFLHDLAGHLTARAMSSFWIGEYDRDDATIAPEFAVVDAIISLQTSLLESFPQIATLTRQPIDEAWQLAIGTEPSKIAR